LLPQFSKKTAECGKSKIKRSKKERTFKRESAIFAMPRNASICFQSGTLVLQDADDIEHIPAPLQFVKGRWCCDAYHYQRVLPWLQEQGMRDAVRGWQHLPLQLHETRELQAYQFQALEAWKQAGARGSIVLPISAAKPLLAVHAIHQVSSSTVIIVPTESQLPQWYGLLSNAFQTEIGVYFRDKKYVRPFTVTTYDDAGDLIAEHGTTFALLICDEPHQVPAKTWGDVARRVPAPFRLGLLITAPEEQKQADKRGRLDDLLGPIVYAHHLESLTEEQLAAYRSQRVLVDLTEEERASYTAASEIYMAYVRAHGLQQRHGAGWVQALMRRSSVDPDARRAWLARQQALKLLESCQGKLVALEALLREYTGERILVFTQSNEVAYTISRHYLVPAISQDTEVAERTYILDAFRAGHYRVIVTSQLLKEGVDVPEAKVTIVLGGGTKKLNYLQHVECSLRKKEALQAVLIEVLVRNTIEEGEV
jgi:superfamily II DNA or RNA helicase